MWSTGEEKKKKNISPCFFADKILILEKKIKIENQCGAVLQIESNFVALECEIKYI